MSLVKHTYILALSSASSKFWQNVEGGKEEYKLFEMKDQIEAGDLGCIYKKIVYLPETPVNNTYLDPLTIDVNKHISDAIQIDPMEKLIKQAEDLVNKWLGKIK